MQRKHRKSLETKRLYPPRDDHPVLRANVNLVSIAHAEPTQRGVPMARMLWRFVPKALLFGRRQSDTERNGFLDHHEIPPSNRLRDLRAGVASKAQIVLLGNSSQST